MTGEIYVPVHDPDFYSAGEQWSAFAMLRREHPVYWHEYDGIGYWVLTRYADIKYVSGKPEIFSSLEGFMPPRPDRPRAVVELSRGSIMQSDPPAHTDMRRAVYKRLTPKAIRAFEEQVQRSVAATFDSIPIGEPFDFVKKVAIVIPAMVICDLIGIPHDQRERYVDLLDKHMHAQDPDFEDATKPDEPPLIELLAALGGIVERRRRDPGDDLASLVVHGLIQGAPLDDHLLGRNLLTLFIGGTETTRAVMAYGLQALLDRPEQLRVLRSDPDLIRPAVEEMIRWTTPIRSQARCVTRDVQIRGQDVRAGEWVTLRYDSANRDEDAFGDDAAVFRVTRDPNPHLAFGTGEHLCIGLHVARLELRLAFSEMIRRFRDIVPVDELSFVRMAEAVQPKRMPLIVRT